MVHRYYFDKQYDNYAYSSSYSHSEEKIMRIREFCMRMSCRHMKLKSLPFCNI